MGVQSFHSPPMAGTPPPFVCSMQLSQLQRRKRNSRTGCTKSGGKDSDLLQPGYSMRVLEKGRKAQPVVERLREGRRTDVTELLEQAAHHFGDFLVGQVRDVRRNRQPRPAVGAWCARSSVGSLLPSSLSWGRCRLRRQVTAPGCAVDGTRA